MLETWQLRTIDAQCKIYSVRFQAGPGHIDQSSGGVTTWAKL